MTNGAIAEAYSFLEQGAELPRALCSRLIELQTVAEECLVSLCLRLLKRSRSEPEDRVLMHFFRHYPNVASLASCAYPVERAGISAAGADGCPFLHGDDELLLDRLRTHKIVGPRLLHSMISRFLNKTMQRPVMALILTMISMEGISDDDTESLTAVMASSGQTFDYRPFASQQNRRIVRRYPTGGISEKVALILPSLLMAMSHDVPLLSTTLVGRSLGFTGGTWDKLGGIEGFEFVEPGAATEKMMALYHVAMCTTGSTVDPADRELYLLRGEIGTIASAPLIVSSICSKHVAIPAHRLLLDVRFGPGAFLRTAAQAQTIAERITATLNLGRVPTSFLLFDTRTLTGSAVGNVLEVIEALAVMGANTRGVEWLAEGLDSQKRTVVAQAAELLSAEFGDFRKLGASAAGVINTYFDNGAVLRGFNVLLKAHGVAPNFADEICLRPTCLLNGLESRPVLARELGFVHSVDQVGLGNCVNFALQNGPVDQPGANRSGVLLAKSQGSYVKPGDVLARAFADKNIWNSVQRDEIANWLTACFRVGSAPFSEEAAS